MQSGKSLAMAYAIKRKKMAAGGMVKKPSKPMHSPKSIVDAIKAKRMAKGGMVEPEPAEDDFLSEDMPEPSWGDRAEMFSDDPDNEVAIEEEVDPKAKRKQVLSQILSGVQRRHMGK